MIVIPEKFTGILEDWLKTRGIVSDSWNKTNKSSKSTLTVEEWANVIHSATMQVQGDALGLEIGQCIQLHHAGPLGYLIVNGQTFGELLETYMLFEKWFYGESWVTCEISDTKVDLRWDDRSGFPDRLFEQVNSMALVTVIRETCPTVGYPIEVDIMNDEEGESDYYHKAFNCPVNFSQKALLLSYPINALAETIDITRASLSTAWNTRERTLSDTHQNSIEFVRSVQTTIFEHLELGAPADMVASNLNLSLRTMQRRLNELGCTYMKLVDRIRERHSKNLLNESHLSLKEIAFLLGYADQSAFNHAYHRWNGHSPLKN